MGWKKEAERIANRIDDLKETVEEAIEDAHITRGIKIGPFGEEKEDVERKQELQELSETYLDRMETAAGQCKIRRARKYRGQLMRLLCEIDYEDRKLIRERLRNIINDLKSACRWTRRKAEVSGWKRLKEVFGR